MKRLGAALVATGAWTAVAAWAWYLNATAGLVAMIALGVFVFRFALAWLDRTAAGPAPDLSVSVVLPMYNEDPELVRVALESLAAQTRLPDRVWVLDDGSSDTAALEVARSFDGPFDLRVVRCETNRGKREVQREAFGHDADADVFVTADSDTVFQPDAIEEGLRPFADPKVAAVAGMVRARNRSRNVLTRIQDAEYQSSFLVERASMSTLGAVLVTSGGLAFYRAANVRAFLAEYLGQRFAGRPVHTGDDRMMTQLSLQRGKVVFQHTSVADTAVPEKVSHLLRQRVRWSRSFWVNSLWVLGNMPVRSWSFALTVYYLVSVGMLLATFGLLAAFAPTLGFRFLVAYMLAIALLTYVRGARLLAVWLPGETVASKLSSYAMLGPYVLFNLAVLVPVRLYALSRVRQVSRWGTRAKVEVSA